MTEPTTSYQAARIRELLDQLVTERDGWRAVAEQRLTQCNHFAQRLVCRREDCEALTQTNDAIRAEVERLREALGQTEQLIAEWCAHTGSTEWTEYLEGKRVLALVQDALK